MAARIMSRFGLLLGFLVCSGCGSPAILQCRVEAVKFLPDDPRQITPYDVADLVTRLHRCKASVGDAGHD